jgi:hypothetical protein
MKLKLLLVLVLILSGGWHSAIAQPSGMADTDGYDWGSEVGGFQMAVSLDQTNGIIHCWIRNATTNEMDYPSFDIGYFEDIRLEFQGATNWITIPTEVFPRAAGYSSACPYLVKRIEARQIITDTYTRSEYRQPWPVQSLEEYLKWTHGNTNEARLTEQLNQRYADREVLLTRLCRDDTFALDLFRGRAWPVLPDQNLVSIRVSQTLRIKRESTVTLYSRVFAVEKSFLQACLKQNLDRHEK